ncbi:thioesterase family protein [Alteromonas aestuariivivens]|uniref:Thioesterase family protein n=1 Tax=Alteromonas aestuariivivens TaxID=1938339 RepID=A0A3D8MBG3_9ALTE|nr:thioesterase family protein [Alteromonas aestuariivivens]RDV27471.1 thioesterase family protein [Alteromonas aestuariivivens]
MKIDELLALPEPEHINEHQWQFDNVTITGDWSQGRTAFGGISAGILYQAARHGIREDRVLRSFNTNFIGPLEVDMPFSVRAQLLREGSNVSQVMVQAIQKGKVCVMSQACFGLARRSKIQVENRDTHSMPLPVKAKFIPQIPKVTPKFLRHFDLAIDDGGIPFTGRSKSHYHGFMRFKDAPQAIGDGHIITMIDAWPPTLLQMMRFPAPASTVSWNLEFIHPHRPVTGADWFAYQAHTRQAADGYGHTEATIWDKDGEVIALSRQTVAIFD